ncbi:hypothetical protein EJV46_05860 [Roseococcus sp. SYP-B2431]|uniref:hypothetical protein n=1 Tax=Roseococcus sp. SYP-B2431 TaxID=2496640 RepID=UPI00103FE9CC|nr:hypothetical protein [Roseococcus sp. SYP-B2431]TCI00175.1 hypothetical protein EJV46_05860 [Roseococcus sp. SYP-B2431]
MLDEAADAARVEVRATLLSLAELEAETEAAERRILAGALDRLEVVCAELDKLRPPILTDREAGDLYRGRQRSAVSSKL